jgi:hypothetical protein
LSLEFLEAEGIKMVRRICFVFIFTIAIVSLIQSCDLDSGRYVPIEEETDIARLDSMRLEILEMIGEAECSNSLDCRYVAFGAKPCGGPWRYLIYSVVTVNENVLLARVAEYNNFNEILNQEYGWVSDCAIVPVPTVGCKDGHCVDLSTQ